MDSPILSNCLFRNIDQFPKEGIYKNHLGHAIDIKVADFLLLDFLDLKSKGLGRGKLHNIDHCHYNEDIIRAIVQIKQTILKTLESGHQDNASLFESPGIKKSNKVLVANLRGYECFKVNGLVQIAIHSLIQGRSPNYFFSWVSNRERQHKGFKAEFGYLEENRDYIIINP